MFFWRKNFSKRKSKSRFWQELGIGRCEGSDEGCWRFELLFETATYFCQMNKRVRVTNSLYFRTHLTSPLNSGFKPFGLCFDYQIPDSASNQVRVVCIRYHKKYYYYNTINYYYFFIIYLFIP